MNRMNVDYWLGDEPYSITVTEILDDEKGIVMGVDDTDNLSEHQFLHALDYAPITINLKETYILSITANFDGRLKYLDLSEGGVEKAWRKVSFFFRRFIKKNTEPSTPIKGPSSIYKEPEPKICDAVLITSSDELDDATL